MTTYHDAVRQIMEGNFPAEIEEGCLEVISDLKSEFEEYEECPACGGCGEEMFDGSTCPTCKGLGEINANEVEYENL